MDKKDFHSDLFDECLFNVANKYLAQVCHVSPYRTPYDDVIFDFKAEAVEEGKFDTEEDIKTFIKENYLGETPLKQLKGYPDIDSKDYVNKASDFLFKEITKLYGTLNKAIQAICNRAADPSARNFTPQQIEDIEKAFEASKRDPLGKVIFTKKEVYDDLFESANEIMDKENVPKKWREDVKAELADLSKGIVRGASGLKM